MKYYLSPAIKAILILCGLALITVLFLPMWKIELNAPQYPEGLVLKIYPDKIGGNVDIVNGLNHYIGMKTLHTEDFFEFTILPYIILLFALFCFIAAMLNRKKWVTTLAVLFIIFGVAAMYDFREWEYNYGHDLNPEAAIQVPGMAYQPPLIGYKQLLNFAAYSIPDTGGYIFFGVGIILLLLLIRQAIKSTKSGVKTAKSLLVIALIVLFFSACNPGPRPIKIGIDNCSFCKMTITDRRFGGEIITKKGKAFKFDDMQCLLSSYKSGSGRMEAKDIYLVDFISYKFITAKKACLLQSEEFHTPMGGNMAAFSSENDLQNTSKQFNGTKVKWKDLKK